MKTFEKDSVKSELEFLGLKPRRARRREKGILYSKDCRTLPVWMEMDPYPLWMGFEN